ncbi:MAG TPA: zinc-dependent alcohol dehydrogenase family protein [Planctomycetota bacterium]|nr:zinc-dependent alcohol dehydrogenase family protein [Planctomycetota bacterium]HRR80424.1 zinc-dependent alcohol dehydrogenase family protein [Planctomycetota bacterium]HRT94114.1 zinc-dependent alcohol dehydrogenase family protein [Planctomycetota bacterium]
MRAMLLEKCAPAEEAPLHLVELPAPRPGRGELLVRVLACGVCHTDLHTIEGDLGTDWVPIIPGHEIIGVVEALGEGCERFRIGQRVGLAWLHWACGRCQFCAAGQENLCASARFTGLHANGGYAGQAKAPESFAYAVPDGLEAGQAAPLMCAGIIGYRALALSDIRPGGRLGLYGFGASAHIAIQIARHWGCEVYVFTRGEEHRLHARELGARWVGDAKDVPPEKLDSAIIFAPAGWIIPLGLRALRRGGTLALAGITMTAIPELDYEADLYYERTLRSVTASTRRDGEALLELAAEIPIRTDTSTYPLADANKALLALKLRQVRGAAVLVP